MLISVSLNLSYRCPFVALPRASIDCLIFLRYLFFVVFVDLSILSEPDCFG